MNSNEPHPLFAKYQRTGQIELFACHMPQGLIDKYQANIKDYKKVQKLIYKAVTILHDLNQDQYDAPEHFDKEGVADIDAYRAEKQWADLKIQAEDFLERQNERKQLLDDWFADFADLLELQNLHNEPMIYY